MARQILGHEELSKELFQAIVSSDVARVREIVHDMKYDVRVPLDMAFSKSDDRLPPLHVACIYTDNLKIFDILYEAPGGHQALNMQPANCQCSSPLILAAKWNRLNVIKFLLKKGADATLHDNDGWTAYKYASQSNYDYVRLNVAELINDAESKLHAMMEELFLDILYDEYVELAKEGLLEEQKAEEKRLKKERSA